MLSSTSSVPGASLASLYANHDNSALLQEFRNADSQVRRNLEKAMASAGQGATVTASFTYNIGPDGQLYATGGTVNTTRKVHGPKLLLPGGQPAQDVTANPGANDRQPQPSAREPLAGFLSPTFGLSPSEMADIFGMEMAEDNILARLRAADSGVRGHEGLHFRAGGGLVSGLPDFDFIEGPDGNYYAVAGSVDIATPATNDTEKAQRDATTFAIAAAAPGDASAQDMSVAKTALNRAAEAYNAVALQTRYGANNMVDLRG